MRKQKLKFVKKMATIPTGIWAVSLSMMLIAASTSMTFSISPFFMKKVLGISMVSLGLMEGITEALSFLSKLISGYTGDFYKRKKPPLMIGVIMATISKPIFIFSNIFANGAIMVMISKVIERISNGIMATPRDAYCAEAGPEKTRGISLGLMMSLKTFGCTLGSITIGVLLIYSDDYRLLLWVGFIPCALSLFILFKYMKENTQKNSIEKQKDKKINFKDFLQLKSKYWSLVLVASFFMLARFTDGFILLRMESIGAPMWLCGMVIGFFNLICALTCLPIGALSDRFDRSRMLYFSFITIILSNLCFIYAPGNAWLSGLGIIFWGSQRGTSQMLFTAIIADEVPERIIGTALGIYYLLSGVGAVLAGLFAGRLAEKSLSLTFEYGFKVSIVAFIALIIRNEVFKHRKIKKSKVIS